MKLKLKEIGYGTRLNSPVAVYSENGNEPPSSVKCEDFFE
jgi:hypothetical protein